MSTLDVNTLLELIQSLRAVGNEQLYAVGVVNGRPVRFAVIAINNGNELELVLERCSWEAAPG